MEFLRRFFRRGKNGKEAEGAEPVRVLLGLRKITLDETLFDTRDSIILEIRDLSGIEKRAIEIADKIIIEKVYDLEEFEVTKGGKDA